MVDAPKEAIDKLGRYFPEGTAAKGGFGEVQICDDAHLRRKVAIKSITNTAENDRLKDEIRALSQLRSKHVVQVYDLAHKKDDSIGIVMEYISGDDLFTSTIPQNSPTDCLKTLWQISSGLTDIHETGIIHRDIKPNNIKFDSESIIKIYDFGLSRSSDDNANTVGFRGTPGFAAPELYAHGKVNFTQAIDTYAFGATALYLATKALPQELLQQPPQPLPINSFVGSLLQAYPDVVGLLVRCLSQNTADRPSIEEVRDKIALSLLTGNHQGLVISGHSTNIVNSQSSRARVKTMLGSFSISYDGSYFILGDINGEVFVNGMRVVSGEQLTGSCVIITGAVTAGMSRSFITFDLSNPEVSI